MRVPTAINRHRMLPLRREEAMLRSQAPHRPAAAAGTSSADRVSFRRSVAPPALAGWDRSRGGRIRFGAFPEVLEPVQLAHARQHDVQDHLIEIDEHPLTFALALDTERTD